MSISPWVWVTESSCVRINPTDASVVAEASLGMGDEWCGWVKVQGRKTILRGPSSEDTTARIDAILEIQGLIRNETPSADTAERVVAALVKNINLAREVQRLLQEHLYG